MGWNTGSEIAEDVWTLVRKFIPLEVRPDIARKVIERFEDADCDTMQEAIQLSADANTDPCRTCPKRPSHCPSALRSDKKPADTEDYHIERRKLTVAERAELREYLEAWREETQASIERDQEK